MHVALGLLVLTLVTTVGCASKNLVRRYYTFTQPSLNQAANHPLAGVLWVHEVEVAPTYNRPQVVFRYSPYELRYFNLEHWADRPQRMMTQQMAEYLRASGMFRQVSERLGADPPEFVLDTNLRAIEQLDGKDMWFAHISMSFRLTRFDDKTLVWQYAFDQRRPLVSPDVGLMVRAVTEIIREQMVIMLVQIETILSGHPLEVLPPQLRMQNNVSTGPASTSAAPSLPEAEMADDLVGETASLPILSRAAGGGIKSVLDWRHSTQYTSDPTIVPPGKGAIFVPALSDAPKQEPIVQVMQGGELVESGFMGRRIPVLPGKYSLYFGSGNLSQRIIREAEVREAEVVIVQPDWAALEISVVNDKFIPFRGSYEIINMENKEYLGVGYGADEELGEKTQVWILPPGLYKVVQPGSNYRARTNFATVQLEGGALVPFLLVLDETSRDFLGAGVEEPGVNDSEGEDSWSYTTSLGGDATWLQRTGGVETGDAAELTFTLYADNLVQYRLGPHQWTTRLEIEESQRVAAGVTEEGTQPKLLEGNIEPVIDRVYLNSLYIYELFEWAGPYVRIGGESALLNRYRYPSATQMVVIDDVIQPGTGDPLLNPDPDPIQVAGFLTPLEFKQGLGVNFRVAHTAGMDLDVRLGVGSRQYLARGLLTVNEGDTTGDLLALNSVNSTNLFGPESTVVGSARVTRYLLANSELDALLPFGGLEHTRFTWRSTLTLRLSTFASLVYALNLDRNPTLNEEKPLATEQSVRLRIFFSPF